MDTTAITTRTSTRTSFFRRTAVALAALTALTVTPMLLAAPAQAAPRKQVATAAPAAHDDVDGGTVNLNTATDAELQLLPGVGPSKAAAILAYRKKYGSFKKVDELGKVKGFSYKTLKKLRPYLAITGTTTYKGKPKKSGTRSADDGANAPPVAE